MNDLDELLTRQQVAAADLYALQNRLTPGEYRAEECRRVLEAVARCLDDVESTCYRDCVTPCSGHDAFVDARALLAEVLR